MLLYTTTHNTHTMPTRREKEFGFTTIATQSCNSCYYYIAGWLGSIKYPQTHTQSRAFIQKHQYTIHFIQNCSALVFRLSARRLRFNSIYTYGNFYWTRVLFVTTNKDALMRCRFLNPSNNPVKQRMYCSSSLSLALGQKAVQRIFFNYRGWKTTPRKWKIRLD